MTSSWMAYARVPRGGTGRGPALDHARARILLARQAGPRLWFLVKSSEVSVDSYQHHRVSRKHEKIPISFATLDFEGLLEVGDPDLFLSTVKRGFGSSKAYGCGLMLLRRA